MFVPGLYICLLHFHHINLSCFFLNYSLSPLFSLRHSLLLILSFSLLLSSFFSLKHTRYFLKCTFLYLYICYSYTHYTETLSVFTPFSCSHFCIRFPHKSFISFCRWHTFHLTGRTAPWCSSHSLMTPLKWIFSMPLMRKATRYERSSMTLVSVVWIHTSSSDKPGQTLRERTDKRSAFFIIESIGWIN